ncbi:MULTISPECIES: hypothetical protein [unclassified Campylobacter]|uniref:hypothetical protein n=1 Tax=unclassified Campylobacter TaxID=2593542 RepID=UPI003D332E55
MSEFLEVKGLLLELRDTINLLLPKRMSVAQIANITGKSRQTITSFLKRKFSPGTEYWEENGKIMVSQAVALTLLRRYNEK